MRARKAGLAMFWIGLVYMVGASWFAMWWVAPKWQSARPEAFAGTVWAFGGPIFMAISFSVPVGILLAAVGMLLYSNTEGARSGPIWMFAVGALLVSMSMLVPSTLAYYPVLFGIMGGVIYLCFFLALWYWAKNRRMLDESVRIAADLQLASYIFFLLAASLSCALLGNPFSGLFFPEKVLQQHALPWHYCMGTKLVIYFGLGWLFSFLSQYMYGRRGRMQESRA